MPLFKPGLTYQTWTPVYTPQGAMTYTGVATPLAVYAVDGKFVHLMIRTTGTIGGTPDPNLDFSLPELPSVGANSFYELLPITNGGADALGYIRLQTGNANARVFPVAPSGNWAAGAGGLYTSLCYRRA